MRRSADVAILITAAPRLSHCGQAFANQIRSGMTLAVIMKSCALGFYVFGHEIAHTFGAYHNREKREINKANPTAYGYLIRPPIKSGYRTIMA